MDQIERLERIERIVTWGLPAVGALAGAALVVGIVALRDPPKPQEVKIVGLGEQPGSILTNAPTAALPTSAQPKAEENPIVPPVTHEGVEVAILSARIEKPVVRGPFGTTRQSDKRVFVLRYEVKNHGPKGVFFRPLGEFATDESGNRYEADYGSRPTSSASEQPLNAGGHVIDTIAIEEPLNQAGQLTISLPVATRKKGDRSTELPAFVFRIPNSLIHWEVN